MRVQTPENQKELNKVSETDLPDGIDVIVIPLGRVGANKLEHSVMQ